MPSGDDPFQRIQAGRSGALSTASAAGGEEAWIGPIPKAAPPPLLVHRTHGAPSTRWEYTTADGELLGFAARFDLPDGSKQVLPLTLWRMDGVLKWAWKAFPAPRPLYRLAEMAARPSAPVLLVEGEKTADAAALSFPDFVVTTWPGGALASGKTDFGPLDGRDVVMWPDADEAGAKAQRAVLRAVASAGAASVAGVPLPTGLPDGWDLADPWPPGMDRSSAAALLETALEAATPAGVTWPWGFRMEPQGLFYDQPTNAGGIVPVRLSAPFELVGEARDPDGAGWSVVIGFEDRDGRSKLIPVAKARLVSGGAEVRAELADAGLVVSPARGKADKFSVALAEVQSTRRLTLVSATGWCGERYVLPSRVIGAATGERVLFTGEPGALHYRSEGSLQGWQAGVAAKAPGNRLLAFSLSLAFLGPLLRLLDIEGGGVHFRGPSSCGKTTLAYAAGSVWGGGGPLGFGQTWRATANALEMVAYGHNDGLAVFDELALVAPEEAGAAAYSLASGQSKARSRSDGSLRRRSEWRVAILSTGEIGLADHIRASRKGDRPMAGQELRLLDIAADGGKRMGVWEDLHGVGSAAALSDQVRQAAARDFGHAGPAFLDVLMRDRAAAVADAKAIVAGFLREAITSDDSGQATRAALRFGAIAAAGELATAFGVLPWAPGAATASALSLFRAWAGSFGRDTSHEEREVLRRLRGVISSERALFSPLGDDDMSEDAMPSPHGRDGEARGLKTHGYRYVRGNEVRYCFHDEGWAHVFAGFNLVDAARIVAAAGFLEIEGGEAGRLKRSMKIKGERHRLYCVRSQILEAALGD